MNFSILDSVDITVWDKEDDEANEYIPKVSRVTVFSKNELDSHDLAYSVFKEAKGVVQLSYDTLPYDAGFVYVVRVTSYTAEEAEHLQAYGDDYDDYND